MFVKQVWRFFSRVRCLTTFDYSMVEDRNVILMVTRCSQPLTGGYSLFHNITRALAYTVVCYIFWTVELVSRALMVLVTQRFVNMVVSQY